ncbi:MAG: SHOCT domain-containing protein [Cyanobacteria bacterium P01_F01_bin.143]
MATNYFITENKDLSNLYRKLILWFKERQYLVESAETGNEYLIQAKKTGTLRTLTGTNQAFKIKIIWAENTDNEFIVETSTGKWVSNLAGAGFSAMFTGGMTVLTGLAGAGWTLVIESKIIDYIENTLNYKRVKNDIEAQPQFSNSISNNFAQYNGNKESEFKSQTLISPRAKAEDKVKEDLLKLEIAYQEQILTKDEFETKKRELERRITVYEIDFVVEEKISKLEQAFVQGILTEDEYEAKIAQVRHGVENQICNQRLEEQKRLYVAKLKQAVEHGIISESECEAKIASYKPNSIS